MYVWVYTTLALPCPMHKDIHKHTTQTQTHMQTQWYGFTFATVHVRMQVC